MKDISLYEDRIAKNYWLKGKREIFLHEALFTATFYKQTYTLSFMKENSKTFTLGKRISMDTLFFSEEVIMTFVRKLSVLLKRDPDDFYRNARKVKLEIKPVVFLYHHNLARTAIHLKTISRTKPSGGTTLQRDRYIFLLRDNKLYCKINDKEEMFEYTFEDIEPYPNIPFYCRLNHNESLNLKDKLKPFLSRKLGIAAKMKNYFLKPIFFIMLPDDVTPYDGNGLAHFFFQAIECSKAFFIRECFYTYTGEHSDNGCFVTISQSNRMTVLTYIKDNGIAAEKFIENRDYTKDELLEQIRSLHDDCKYTVHKIYLNGEHLSHYHSVADKEVSHLELMDNVYKQIPDILKAKSIV